jgi:4-amino-4-deoxy-L-arabinose transferase-like glycosyltransferase
VIGFKLLRIGVHGDGVEYASVARNLAEGVGTFWKPYLDDYLHPVFHEHPPLVFWIQSLAFKAFGNGPYLEGLYGFFLGFLILYATALLWLQARRDFEFPEIGSWWPLLLLVPLPIFTYILQINRLANTWMLLALIAVYLSYLSAVKSKLNLLYSVLAGSAIYAGFIAKGPVAFFVFAVPALAWVSRLTNFSRAVTVTLIALLTFAVMLLATFLFFPDSIEFWERFWQAQVMASLKSERGAADPHWHIWERWIAEMIVPILIVAVFMLVFKVSPRKLRFNRHALFFFLIAFAASAPFTISTRQHSRYILHSFPLYVICLAFVAENLAIRIETTLTQKTRLRLGTAVLAILFIVAGFAGMLIRKDHVANRKPFYYDIYLQQIKLPERITVTGCPRDMIYRDWLFADMQRFYRNSMSPKMSHDYLLIDKNSDCQVPEGYERINREPTLKYWLYKKNADTMN